MKPAQCAGLHSLRPLFVSASACVHAVSFVTNVLAHIQQSSTLCPLQVQTEKVARMPHDRFFELHQNKTVRCIAAQTGRNFHAAKDRNINFSIRTLMQCLSS